MKIYCYFEKKILNPESVIEKFFSARNRARNLCEKEKVIAGGWKLARRGAETMRGGHHNGPSDDPFVKVLRSLRRERCRNARCQALKAFEWPRRFCLSTAKKLKTTCFLPLPGPRWFHPVSSVRMKYRISRRMLHVARQSLLLVVP